MNDHDRVVYCYGFVPGDTAPPPDDLRGVGGRPVETVDLGFCGAVVSRVPEEEFDAEAVEARLRDMEWVGEQGLGHERVVTWFVDEAWILPARLLTLYSSTEALREEAASREDEIRGVLERMHGRREWDLKVSYDADRLSENIDQLSEEIAELDEEIAGSSSGRGYLLGRVRSEKVRSETTRAARSTADDLLERLGQHAEKVVRLELPRQGDELPVVLSAALLVAPAGEEALKAEVDRRSGELEELGIHAALSGPWAPYRFVGERDEPASAGSGGEGVVGGPGG